MPLSEQCLLFVKGFTIQEGKTFIGILRGIDDCGGMRYHRLPHLKAATLMKRNLYTLQGVCVEAF